MLLRPNPKTTLVLFALAAWALLSVLSDNKAWALYPDRIVKIVVPFAPGRRDRCDCAHAGAGYLRGEEARWRGVIQDAGIKVE